MNAGMPALFDADSSMPEGWGKQSLSTLAAVEKNAVVGGPFGSDLVSKDYTPSGVPVIRGQNMGEKFVGNDFVYVSNDKAKSISANTAKPNDIIFTQRGTLGQVSIVPVRPYPRYVISQSQMKITLDKRRSDPFYIWHFFNSTQQQKVILSSAIQTGVPHINLKIMREFSVSVPPLPEQQAIATALNDIDDLIASLDALIAKKRDIKQAAMQQLLTGKTRLPGFDRHWVSIGFSNFAPLQRGFDLPTRQLKAGRYPVAYSNGVLTHHNQFMVSGPGVVTGRSGTIGKITYVEDHFWPHNTALWVTSFEKSHPKFVYYYLQHMNLARFATGSGVPTLNRNDVHAQVIEVPESKIEQAAIADVLSDLDDDIAALILKFKKAQALREGMMQQLLTGRIRLV